MYAVFYVLGREVTRNKLKLTKLGVHLLLTYNETVKTVHL